MRIALAGFQHETNTFAPAATTLADFMRADSWPRLLRGDDIISETLGMNLPIAGAIAQAGPAHLVPLLWCAAEPSGKVTTEAFDAISDDILVGLEDADDIDGLYLDLHGAMVTEGDFDGEAALLRRIRERVGSELPIAVSLDLHANLSAELVDIVDIITVYRSYPHLDMAETGARAMKKLQQRIYGTRPAACFIQAPFLVPLSSQDTNAQPFADVYDRVASLPQSDEEHLELALGFTAADIPECGPAILAYAPHQERADYLAETLLSELIAAERHIDTALWSPRAAVDHAMMLKAQAPVVLADVQDNPGAGGTSDTTGLLQALIMAEAPCSIIGVICDSEFATTAHKVGQGAEIDLDLGGKRGGPGAVPVSGPWRILSISAEPVAYTGEMYGGGMAELGQSARVQHIKSGVQVIVASTRSQCLDRAFFTHFGVDLADMAIIAVKSTLHFRADFEPIAAAVLNVASPGLFACELDLSDYINLRPGMRVAGAQYPRGTDDQNSSH